MTYTYFTRPTIARPFAGFADEAFFEGVRAARLQPELDAGKRDRFLYVRGKILRHCGYVAVKGNTQSPNYIWLHENHQVLEVVQDFLRQGFDPNDDAARQTYLEGIYDYATDVANQQVTPKND